MGSEGDGLLKPCPGVDSGFGWAEECIIQVGSESTLGGVERPSDADIILPPHGPAYVPSFQGGILVEGVVGDHIEAPLADFVGPNGSILSEFQINGGDRITPEPIVDRLGCPETGLEFAKFSQLRIHFIVDEVDELAAGIGRRYLLFRRVEREPPILAYGDDCFDFLTLGQQVRGEGQTCGDGVGYCTIRVESLVEELSELRLCTKWYIIGQKIVAFRDLTSELGIPVGAEQCNRQYLAYRYRKPHCLTSEAADGSYWSGHRSFIELQGFVVIIAEG